MRTGFSLLVAGYGGTNSSEDAEILTATIPTRDIPARPSAQPVTGDVRALSVNNGCVEENFYRVIGPGGGTPSLG